jgi:SAM-dependent methyltransferase
MASAHVAAHVASMTVTLGRLSAVFVRESPRFRSCAASSRLRRASLASSASLPTSSDAMGPPGAGEGVPNDFCSFNKAASSVAAERNKAPIASVIVPILEDASPGIVLELACGTGQHAAHFAPLLPELVFQPTDLDDSAFDAIAHHVGGLPNVRPPLVLDASDRNWPALRVAEAAGAGGVAAVLIINLTHISPWVATLGAVRGAAEALRPGGKLIIYGPFKIDGRHTSEGNATFDESLRGQNPDWGYRDVEAVVAIGEDCGLRKLDVVEMPANNLTLVLCKRD